MFGIVWVYNKLINTLSMIVSPSTILLQSHVGRGLHASDPEKISITFLPTLRQVWQSSGGITACRCYNSRCLALYGCI